MHLSHRTFTLTLTAAVLFLVNPSYPATATIDLSRKHQTIEGFGGGLLFDVYPYGRTNKEELYDSLFNVAGVNLVRLENRYDHDTGVTLDEVKMMKEIQEKWPQVKIFLTGWSPPGYLKSNDSTAGKAGSAAATLKKNDNGSYMYAEFGDWWQKSIKFFDSADVKIDWISIQNEPNWPADWRGCYLSPTEDTSRASYGKALDAVYSKLRTMEKPVKLIGPDITGIGENNLEKYFQSGEMNLLQLNAVCHHYYNGADSATMKKILKLFPEETLLYQTEMLYNDGNVWPIGSTKKWWFDHAQLIQSALVDEGVSMYNLFALTYKHASTHCCFSLDDESGGPEFTVRPIYYAFKQFSRSINRGWKRIDAGADQTGLKISAFVSPAEDSMAVVIVNGSTTGTTLALNLPTPFTSDSAGGEIYQTSESVTTRGEIVKKYNSEGNYRPGKVIDIDARSITTVDIFKGEYAGSLHDNHRSPMDKTVLCGISTISPGNLAVHCNVLLHQKFVIELADLAGRIITMTEAEGCGKMTAYRLGSRPVAGVYLIALSINNAVIGMRQVTIY